MRIIVVAFNARDQVDFCLDFIRWLAVIYH
jgi:hypothetical protein